ncbi:MAG: hypothetical protein KAW56_03800 [Candidatus Marinimicrobia bacterium]|nr:hypothetical protein [Candidatus Neomarinimicrobiota bacterium]MCK4446185.1 hypothetical protein [Candidatus Neomarinimicrobiota bacterium]
MTPINDISGIINRFERIDREKDLKQVKSSKKTGTGKVSTASTNDTKEIKKDSVNISSSGKSLFRQKSEISYYLKELESIKTLSKEDLIKVHQRIKSNFYSKPEVLATIVENIVSQGPADTQKASESNEKPQQLSEIRSKIINGEYDSEEVLDVIVEKLLNPDII